jgi:uncharacterized membrane protein (DUF485 family)
MKQNDGRIRALGSELGGVGLASPKFFEQSALGWMSVWERANKTYSHNETQGGTLMDQMTARRIENDPNYQKLVSERKSLGWTLAIITLIMYYGYIAIVAFIPSLIAAPLFGSITVGIVLGVAIILASILLTGIYVVRANSDYDDLTAAIVSANNKGAK